MSTPLLLARLDSTLNHDDIGFLSDAAYLEVGNREKPEDQQAGLSDLRQIKRAFLAALWNSAVDEGSGEVTLTGAIPAFEAATDRLSRAEAAEIHEREKAANAAFQALWKAAQPLSAEDASPLEALPDLSHANAGNNGR